MNQWCQKTDSKRCLLHSHHVLHRERAFTSATLTDPSPMIHQSCIIGIVRVVAICLFVFFHFNETERGRHTHADDARLSSITQNDQVEHIARVLQRPVNWANHSSSQHRVERPKKFSHPQPPLIRMKINLPRSKGKPAAWLPNCHLTKCRRLLGSLVWFCSLTHNIIRLNTEKRTLERRRRR